MIIGITYTIDFILQFYQ